MIQCWSRAAVLLTLHHSHYGYIQDTLFTSAFEKNSGHIWVKWSQTGVSWKKYIQLNECTLAHNSQRAQCSLPYLTDLGACHDKLTVIYPLYYCIRERMSHAIRPFSINLIYHSNLYHTTVSSHLGLPYPLRLLVSWSWAFQSIVCLSPNRLIPFIFRLGVKLLTEIVEG